MGAEGVLNEYSVCFTHVIFHLVIALKLVPDEMWVLGHMS